jgi:hypothetical protein
MTREDLNHLPVLLSFILLILVPALDKRCDAEVPGDRIESEGEGRGEEGGPRGYRKGVVTIVLFVLWAFHFLELCFMVIRRVVEKPRIAVCRGEAQGSR